MAFLFVFVVGFVPAARGPFNDGKYNLKLGYSQASDYIKGSVIESPTKEGEAIPLTHP
jgi:hypothetical protein